MRMLKTPKVSPLSNRAVRAQRVPPVKSAQASHPGGVPEQWDMPGVGALFQSATTLWQQSGGIRSAQTTRLPSGDTFSVIERVKFFKLPSGDTFSVIERVKLLKLPSSAPSASWNFNLGQLLYYPLFFLYVALASHRSAPFGLERTIRNVYQPRLSHLRCSALDY